MVENIQYTVVFVGFACMSCVIMCYLEARKKLNIIENDLRRIGEEIMGLNFKIDEKPNESGFIVNKEGVAEKRFISERAIIEDLEKRKKNAVRQFEVGMFGGVRRIKRGEDK